MTEKTMQPFIDSPSSLFVTDGSGNILISNEFTALTLGMSLEELLQLNVQDLVKAGYYKHSITMEAIQTKQKVCKTIKTNRGFNIRSTATPLLYKSGEVQLVVTTSNNIKIENQQTFIEVDSVNKMEEQEKKREQQKLVVESLAMKQIMKVCRKISHYNSKILIYGESGTGKEVIAKYIHQHSDRADGPFITINCAAIPHSLFEYELFGYEKGVLAGVFDEKKGMIEEANNGYLFLDEISEIPLEMQAKLLRVLEENELRRIGGTKQIPINCRVITATNCDLWGLVQQNKFREDLYYRINVIPIYIPPLRHRKPDLVGLLSYFLQNINDNYGTNYRFKAEEFEYMLHQEWPGNARELRNYIERLVLTEQTVMREKEEQVTDWFTLDYFIKSNMSKLSQLKDYTAITEGRYIQQMIEICNNNSTEAAKKLGIDRSVIYRKLKKMEKVLKDL